MALVGVGLQKIELEKTVEIVEHGGITKQFQSRTVHVAPTISFTRDDIGNRGNPYGVSKI